ncbi:hypothetical protein CONPUDRAFT_75754 [Coniophora puteana RWD-64-598 SS2]|uniref:Uncharacterized protein n=1 Tax=Coniophora puteana (strain RWD-64-598) TaxID=741705 RepID=A0A5M3MG92_CONPW|nr:uncharacterized protein CONPUDRAFT_75754 [Coniophora puteana RWD-64-598 SS2]EIW78016.1 hypothetical protein CONPUDRAFT_75754 [Coniophora puteana RWD-64-598 SS2]
MSGSISSEASLYNFIEIARYSEVGVFMTNVIDSMVTPISTVLCLDQEINNIWEKLIITVEKEAKSGHNPVHSVSYMNFSISKIAPFWYIQMPISLVDSPGRIRRCSFRDSRKSRAMMRFLTVWLLVQQIARVIVFASQYHGVAVNDFGYTTCMVVLITSSWSTVFDSVVVIALQTYILPKLLGLLSMFESDNLGLSAAEMSAQVLWMSVIGPRTILNIRTHAVAAEISRGEMIRGVPTKTGKGVELTVTVHAERVNFL